MRLALRTDLGRIRHHPSKFEQAFKITEGVEFVLNHITLQGRIMSYYAPACLRLEVEPDRDNDFEIYVRMFDPTGECQNRTQSFDSCYPERFWLFTSVGPSSDQLVPQELRYGHSPNAYLMPHWSDVDSHAMDQYFKCMGSVITNFNETIDNTL